jgi:hypothetical protein
VGIIIQKSLAIFLTGLVIKLMDDYLDQEIDRANNRYSWAMKLETRIVPYTLLILSLAMFFDYKLSIALLWASYIVGMGVSTDNLAVGLKTYQEVIILLMIGFFILDIKQFLFSLVIILFIQASDDYIDYHREKYISSDNFINYLGRAGTLFIIVFSLVTSLNINWQLSLLVIVFSFIISILVG